MEKVQWLISCIKSSFQILCWDFSLTMIHGLVDLLKLTAINQMETLIEDNQLMPSGTADTLKISKSSVENNLSPWLF